MHHTAHRAAAPARAALPGAVLFLAVTLFVLARQRPGLDVAVTSWVGARQEPWLVVVMDSVRVVGSQLPLALTPVLAVVLWLRHAARDGTLLLGTVGATLAIGVAVKLLVVRPRPEPAMLTIPSTGGSEWSFPSSSVAVAVAFWGIVLGVRAARTSPLRRRALVAVGALVVTLVGVSRLYVGEHWLTDVLAGYVLGATVLTVGWRIAGRASGSGSSERPGSPRPRSRIAP